MGRRSSAKSLRRKRLTAAALVSVLVSAAALAALIEARALQIAFAALALTALFLGAILQIRESRAEQSAELASLLRLRIRAAHELSPHEVGVAPEAPQALREIGRESGDEYVARDVDKQLEAAFAAALDRGGASMIVVSGPSKAGKTRTLYEAMRRCAPEGQLVAPATADSIDELMQPGALPKLKGDLAVVWLDDLEPFTRTGPHGMHPGVLDQLENWQGRVVVLATMGGKGVQQAGETTQFSVPMAELMRHAREIRLSSKLSASELRRVEAYAPQAAARIASDGIGEYMIAAPDLERKLTSGCHAPGEPASPHGQAITRVVIDWQRSGLTDPIPRLLLRETYEDYLPDHLDPSDAAFEEGLGWARRPLYATVALLGGRGTYRAYDHIVAFTEASPGNEIDERAWMRFLEAANSEQALSLASRAYLRCKAESSQRWASLAERAVRQAAESEHDAIAAHAAFNLGVLLEDQGDAAGALAAYRRATARGEKAGAFNVASLLREQGDLDGAEAAYREAENAGELAATVNLGNLMRERGNLDGAEASYRRAEEAGLQAGGFNLALLLRVRGDLEGALAVYRRLEAAGHSEASPHLGSLLYELGDVEGAEAACRRGEEAGYARPAPNLKLDPDSAPPIMHSSGRAGKGAEAFELGHALRERGDLDGAAAAYSRAEEAGHALASVSLGLILREQGDIEGAEAALRRASPKDPAKG